MDCFYFCHFCLSLFSSLIFKYLRLKEMNNYFVFQKAADVLLALLAVPGPVQRGCPFPRAAGISSAVAAWALVLSSSSPKQQQLPSGPGNISHCADSAHSESFMRIQLFLLTFPASLSSPSLFSVLLNK